MKSSVLPALAAAFAVGVAGCGGAQAATASAQFNVTINIQSTCQIANATNMAFPAAGSLTSAVNQTSTFDVTCTATTPYTVGLDPGANASGSQRRMRGGAAEFISYNLFSDSSRLVPWGNVSGSWVSGSGTGLATTYTVYGQVPPQTTPSPSSYTDTVTVTVTF